MSSFSSTPRPMCLRLPPQEASLEAALLSQQVWSIGAGCPSFGGQRTALSHRKNSALQESRLLAGRVRAHRRLGPGPSGTSFSRAARCCALASRR
jgi:hypothetical protein